MEINSSYSAKSIPKVDNTAYGKDAKVDNFADLLSTVTDKNSNKNNLQNTTSAKKSASNSDNSATKDVQNTKDIQNSDAQDGANIKNVTSQDTAPTVVADDDTAIENSNANIENNGGKIAENTDGEKNPLIDAQQAMLALILNQGQQPVENATTNLTSDAATVSANDVAAVIDNKQGNNNPALLAALAQNGDNAATELKIAMPPKENGKTDDGKNGKLDFSLKTSNPNIIPNDGTQNNNPANNVANQNPDQNLNNPLIKTNNAHQPAQTFDAGIKTQDLSSANTNTLAVAENSTTSNSQTTTDINKSPVDQNTGLRINLDNIQSLAAIMVRKHFSGEKTFTIRLDPPELGEIKVELKIDKDKRAKAVISASNHEALGDLTKSVKELAQSLKDGGVDINEEDFEFNLNQQSNDNEFAQNAKSQSNDKSSDKNTSEEVQPEIINQINRDINRTQVWHNVRVSLIA